MAFDLAILAYFQGLLLLVFEGRSRFVKGVTKSKKRTSLPRFVNCFSKRIIERTSAWIQVEVTDYTFLYIYIYIHLVSYYCIILYHIIVCMIAFVDYFNISNM